MVSSDANPKKDASELEIKVFRPRESLITELLEVKHFKILKNAFFALLFGFISKDVIQAITGSNNVGFGLRTIKESFQNFNLALLYWILLFTIHLLVYAFFKCWALKRITFNPKSTYYRNAWDAIFLTLTLLYDFSCLLIFPAIPYHFFNLGIATSFAINAEIIRFVMKSHAFIRTASPKILVYKPHDDKEIELPTFGHYLYFSFAPTILYRSQYPRTETVNYYKAAQHFLEVLGIVWLESYIFDVFFRMPFQKVGTPEFEWSGIPAMIVENSLGGGLLMLINFYLLLHAWCNGFAEILRFADRRFYEDWWTSTNYSTFFRRWNNVVQDWLYEYIYRDFYLYVIPNNGNAAKWAVFLISALVHEYLVFLGTKHFLPITFIQFFCGAIFSFMRTKHPLCNVFLLYSVSLGNSIQVCIHAIEYFARSNCPQSPTDLSSYLLKISALECL